MTSNTPSRFMDVAIDWGRVEVWCELSSGKAICGPVLERLRAKAEEIEAERDDLEEQLETEHAVAEVFRRLLRAHHRVEGLTLAVEVEIPLSDDEFDLVWDHALPPLEDDTVLSIPASLRDGGGSTPCDPVAQEPSPAKDAG